MSIGIHQVVAGAAPRDAITNHVMAAREVIRAAGLRSEVFGDSRHIAGDLTNDVFPEQQWGARARSGDLAILHYSIDSPAFAYVRQRAARSAIHYHNVTPPELLWTDAPALAMQCADGRRRLGDFADLVTHAAADSAFNAAELDDLGFPDAQVIGVLRQAGTPQREPRSARSDIATRVLFVGRGVPNKCQHDAILAIGALRQAGHTAELRLVGAWGGNRAYLERCRWTAHAAGVADAVHFLGSVTDDDLAQEYAHADLFLCLSEHEGYCVPVLEAIAAGLPLIGFNAGAVPETMGAAGLVLDDKRPSVVAEAIMAVRAGALDDRMRLGRAEQGAQHSQVAVADRLVRFVKEFAA